MIKKEITQHIKRTVPLLAALVCVVTNQKRICIVSLFLIFTTLTIAQPTVSITASKSTIRTGEPDTLTLSAVWPGHQFQQGFAVADSFPHFEVWDKGTFTKTENGIIQNIVVTSYDSGRFNLPPLALIEAPAVAADSFPINIQPVNIDTLQDYHDIKDIIEVPPVSQWPFITLIAGLTIASIVGLYFLLKKLKATEAKATVAKSKIGAYQKAKEALQKLEPQTKQPGPAKPFFVSLTSIYRTYLSEAYHWRSLQQTGGELILQAKPLLAETDFYNLTNAIRLSDAAKFAKYEPPQTDWQIALAAIQQTIDHLEKQLDNNRFKPQDEKSKGQAIGIMS